MKAIAVSNYPNDFNEHKIKPELQKRGIGEVDFFTSQQFLEVKKLDNCNAIFCFFDLMSHNHYELVKNLAKKSDVKFHILTRKTASWPVQVFQTKEPEVTMAQQRSVSENDIPSLVQEYDDLIASNVDRDVIVRKLAKYWKGRPLNNYAQLRYYVERNRGSIHARVVNRNEDTDLPYEGNLSENGTKQETESGIVAAKTEVADSQLLEIAENENRELRLQLKSALAEMNVLKDEIRKLTAKVNCTKSELKNGQAKEAISAVRKLISLGMMSADEGLLKIETYLGVH